MRRDLKGFLRAHEMDHKRRTLIVEGRCDHLFIRWLLGTALDRDCQLLEVSFLEVTVSEGGERARCLEVARVAEGDNIRVFVDADFDRLIGREAPNRVWFTDFRDLEAYYQRVECFEKLLMLSLGRLDINAAEALEYLVTQCRRLACLRLLSNEQYLDLPFQKTDLGRCSVSSKGLVEVDFNRYLKTLLQNAGITLARLASINKAWDEVEIRHGTTDSRQLVHGSDFIALVSEIVLEFGQDRAATEAILRGTFERELARGLSSLDTVVRFLSPSKAWPEHSRS